MRPAVQNDNQLMLLTFAGLGQITLDLLGMSGQILRMPNHDLIILQKGITKVPDLGTCEDCFYLLLEPRRIESKSKLRPYLGGLVAGKILRGIGLRRDFSPASKPRKVTYNTFIKQDQDRRLYRRDLSNLINQRINRLFPRWRVSDPASLEIWGFHVSEKLYLGLRLTTDRTRLNYRSIVLRKGALRPSVAAALAFVADPKAGERVLDPMCGSGTILHACYTREPGAIYYGNDIAADAVATSQTRLSNVALSNVDASRLPHAPGSICLIVSNIPFGRQYGNKGALMNDYTSWLKHWLELLKEDGRLVLLAEKAGPLAKVLNGLQVDHSVMAQIKLLGLWTQIHAVRKRS